MKPVLRFGVALALVGAIGACGSDSTGPTFDDTVTTANVEGAAESGFQAANELMSMLASGSGPAAPAMVRARALVEKALTPAPMLAARGLEARAPSFGATMPRPTLAATGIALVAPGCSSSESGTDGGGDPLDANGNGVPDDYRFSLHCEIPHTVGTDSILTERQDVVVTFRERTGDLFGYELAVRQESGITTNFGVYQRFIQEQEEGVSLRPDHASTHSLDRSEIRVKPASDEDEIHVESLQRGEMNFDPDGTIAFESALPDGEVTLNGEFRYIDSTEPIALRFVLDTPTALIYSGACAVSDDQPFVGGILRGRFNGRSSVGFEITFNGCGIEPSLETFGTDDGAPAAHPFAAHSFRR